MSRPQKPTIYCTRYSHCTSTTMWENKDRNNNASILKLIICWTKKYTVSCAADREPKLRKCSGWGGRKINCPSGALCYWTLIVPYFLLLVHFTALIWHCCNSILFPRGEGKGGVFKLWSWGREDTEDMSAVIVVNLSRVVMNDINVHRLGNLKKNSRFVLSHKIHQALTSKWTQRNV